LKWYGETGAKGAEIRTTQYGPIHEITYADAKKFAAALKKAGIRVTALAPFIGKCDLRKEDEVKQHLAWLDHVLNLAPLFETTKVRAFYGLRFNDIPSMADKVLEFGRRLCDALPDGTDILVENEPATGGVLLEQVVYFCQQIDPKRFKIILDPGNYGYCVELARALAVTGTTMQAMLKADVQEFYEHVDLVHAKNACSVSPVQADTVALDDGGGIVDFTALLRVFKELGLFVPIDLEPHRKEAGQQLDEATRTFPGMAGYAGPENATHDFNALKRMIAEVQG